MAAPGSLAPPQERPAGGCAHISVFLDTDLGTYLALDVAADSSIRRLKSQVAVEHAAAFPDIGPVIVKSFQVLRKGAMYYLSDSMAVRSAFAEVKTGCFLHAKMAAVEADTHCRRDEDRGRSSEGCLGFDVDTRAKELPVTISEIARDVLAQRLEGAEDARVLNSAHAHDAVPNDVHLPYLSEQNAELKESEAVSLDNDVQTISVSVTDKPKSYIQVGMHGDQTGGAYVSSTSVTNVNIATDQSNLSLVGEDVVVRKEDPRHSFQDNDLGVVSWKKQVEMEGTVGEVHPLDNLSRKKEGKKARKTGCFDKSAADLVRESKNPETTVVNNSDRVPLETDTNSHWVCSSTSFQQEVHGNLQEDSVQIENPIMTGKNKKRKKRQLAPAESASVQEMTKPLTGAVAVLEEPIGEDMLHEDNQGPQDDDAHNVEMNSREKTMVKQSDMFLLSSQLNSGSQGTKSVQLVSNAQATSYPVVSQGDINLVHEWYRNPTTGDTSDSTSKVIASEDTSTKGITDGYQGEGTVEASNMEKGSKSNNILKKIHKASNTSQEKNCDETNKDSYVGTTFMDTAEEKNHCGYGEKAANSDIISTHGEIVNDSYKRHNSRNVMENPIGDGKKKRKKKKRGHSKSSENNPTQTPTESSGFFRNASSTQNTSAHPLDATQTTLSTIGEETGEEKDCCRHGEKAAKPAIVSTQEEIVKKPIYVQEGDSDAIEAPNGDGKRKKKRGRHSESSKHDPTQDLTKSSRYVTNRSLMQKISADPLNAKKQTTPSTMGEATVIACKKLDENLGAETTNVIGEVLADLKFTGSIGKDLNGDPLAQQTHVGNSQNELGILGCTADKDGLSAEITPKFQADVHFDSPISSPNHKKSNGKQLKVLPSVLDSLHSSGGVPEEKANTELRECDSLRCSDSDLKCVLTENTVVPADDNIKSMKRQRKNTSLKHISRDSGKAIQSSAEQVNQVALEDSKGANVSRAELVQGGSEIDAPATTVQKTPKKRKRSSKTQAPKTQEINRSQFSEDRQDEYVPDIGGIHDNDSAVETPTESLVDLKDGTIVTYDSPNAQKGRKKSSKTELQSQHTDLELGSDADLMNFRAQQRTIIPISSADAVEPNGYLAVHPGKDKINFIDHFSPSGTNGPFDSAENNKDETIGEVKGKKKSKRKTMQSEQNYKISLTDQFGPGNVGVASDLAGNTNKEDGSLKNIKEKKKKKRKTDLVKPESQNPNEGHQDVVNFVQKEMNGQNNEKGNNGKVTQKNSMLQQKIEDAASESTLEKKSHQSIFDAGVQNNLANDKDYVPMIKEQRDFPSQTKHHVSGRTDTNTNAVSNLVNSFSMSPPASSQSAEGISQNANRYRAAVRKVPMKGHDQVSDKSQKDNSKRGASTIFSDAISEGSDDDVLNSMSKKASMEASSDDSSTSADSGISSAARYGSGVPDDEIVPLSQRSLKEGLHIGSILRGSRSYKKARRKQTEDFDNSEIPDSQPDGRWD